MLAETVAGSGSFRTSTVWVSFKPGPVLSLQFRSLWRRRAKTARFFVCNTSQGSGGDLAGLRRARGGAYTERVNRSELPPCDQSRPRACGRTRLVMRPSRPQSIEEELRADASL